ncbi:hypothetical protein XAB3213_4280011 [Xanthomonas citri pv. bilvae]|nr:hypothetical protein XAB3213_4280011 [Xanthomonas citri pv. bilvae]
MVRGGCGLARGSGVARRLQAFGWAGDIQATSQRTCTARWRNGQAQSEIRHGQQSEVHRPQSGATGADRIRRGGLRRAEEGADSVRDGGDVGSVRRQRR